MIFGFTGKAGSGKDTCADYLVKHYGFRKLSWAAPLKAGLAAMGFPEPQDRTEKELTIEGFDFSWRQAAQQLGTEFGRALDPNIWIKLAARQIDAEPNVDWVISDVRFENEAAMVRSLGGIVVHLYGREAYLGPAAGHASEKGVEFLATKDVLMANTGDHDLLHAYLRSLVKEHA